MTDYVITAGRSSTYPTYHYGGHFVGTRATFFENGDFATGPANAMAIPNLPISLLSSGPLTIDAKFFGMHIQHRANDGATNITHGTVRSLDFSGGTSFWHKIETSAGVFNWTDLDLWVNSHYAAGRDLVIVLFGTPRFTNYSARPNEQGIFGTGALGAQAEPSDMTKWSTYCTAVATRYLGKVKYYEVWNEPNLNNNGAGTTTGTAFFFSGTFAKLSEMTRLANQAIKAVDATAKIISPALTGWGPTAGAVDTWFTNMMSASDGATGTMANWVDIVGQHLYITGNDTSRLSGMIDRINASKVTAGLSSGMEIWDTESAAYGPDASLLSDTVVNQHTARSLITMAAKGVARTMYYQYDHGTMGIVGRPAVIAYRETIRTLLMGGTIATVFQFADKRQAYYTSAGGLTFF